MTDPEPAAGGTEYLTAADVAAELGVHIRTARRFFSDDGLPGRKIGKQWTTTRAALDAWIAGSSPASTTAPAYVTHQQPPPIEHKDTP